MRPTLMALALVTFPALAAAETCLSPYVKRLDRPEKYLYVLCVDADAKDNDFIIVSKDADFYQRSLLFGHPPKTIWIRRGNCSTSAVEMILRSHHDAIATFYNDALEAVLILF